MRRNLGIFQEEVKGGVSGFSPISLLTSISAVKSGGGGGDLITGDLDTSGASLIVIATSSYGGLPNYVDDNKGNSYQEVESIFAGGSVYGALYYAENPNVGTGHHFRANASYHSIAVMLFRNVAASSARDLRVKGDDTDGSVFIDAGNASEDNELIVSMLAGDRSTAGIDPPFNQLFNIGFHPGEYLQLAAGYYVQTTAADAQAIWSMPSGFGGAVLGSFKHA